MKRIKVKASPKGIEILNKMRTDKKERMQKLLDKLPPAKMVKGNSIMYWNPVLKEYHGHPPGDRPGAKCKCKAYSPKELIDNGYKPL